MPRPSAILALLTVLACSVQFCAAQSHDVPRSDIEQIVGATFARNGAMEFLEALADRIGGRVTGSAESAAAAALLLDSLGKAGLTHVHAEPFALASGWRRGHALASVTFPVSQQLLIGSYGWAPGTGGTLEATLRAAKMSPAGTLDVPAADLRGAAVLVDIDVPGVTYGSQYVVLRTKAMRALAEAGAKAMLIPSDKPNRLLYTSAFGLYPRAGLPALSVAKEDSALLRRLLGQGSVRVRLDVENAFPPVPAGERNIVAEIPGTGPDLVLVGAHFDSWDWGQGANDNGSGVAAVLEAARILRSMNVRPAATLRFVFFSGEEQGCLGSQAYLQAHRSELDRYRMLLILDGGAQMPLGIALKGRHDLIQPLTPLVEPLRAVGANHLLPDGEVGSDDEPFIIAGIPALELMTDPGDYDTHHHAITDTLDKVDARALNFDTAALALFALAVAQAKAAPGGRLQAAQVLELLERTGMLSEARLMRGEEWVPR